MSLDLTNLKNAVPALKSVVKISQDSEFMGSLNDTARSAIKSGVIQHFEFTYELCWKFMKRWLEENIGSYMVDGVPRRELFRLAAENLLIDDVDVWMKFHNARNLMSHTYQRDTAESVYNQTPEFAVHAEKLLKELEERND